MWKLKSFRRGKNESESHLIESISDSHSREVKILLIEKRVKVWPLFREVYCVVMKVKVIQGRLYYDDDDTMMMIIWY